MYKLKYSINFNSEQIFQSAKLKFLLAKYLKTANTFPCQVTKINDLFCDIKFWTLSSPITSNLLNPYNKLIASFRANVLILYIIIYCKIYLAASLYGLVLEVKEFINSRYSVFVVSRPSLDRRSIICSVMLLAFISFCNSSLTMFLFPIRFTKERYFTEDIFCAKNQVSEDSL